MSTNANNNEKPNQGCNNVVNISERDCSSNSNRSSSSSSNTSKPESQSSPSPRVMTINCGNNVTTTNNYIVTTSPKEKNEIPIQSTILPKVIIVTHDKNSGNSTKKTRRDGYCDEHDIYLNPRTKRTKLKSIAVKKKPPSRPNYLESSHSQGGIVRSDPSPEVEEVEIFPAPKKEDVEIINVNAETLVQDVTEKNDL